MQQLSALGIDLTSLIIYLVNFGLIYIIVSKLISKPIIEILEKRKNEIETNLNEANKLREEMLEEKKKFEAEKEKIRDEFDLELEKFEASILEKSRKLEQENHKIREDIIQKAQIEQKQIKENIFKIVQEDLLNSYSVIVSKVLKDHATKENVSESIKTSWETFKNKKL
jgi:F-type H+-transporting ATPase subunit b